jgi:hypothetical protein
MGIVTPCADLGGKADGRKFKQQETQVKLFAQ